MNNTHLANRIRALSLYRGGRGIGWLLCQNGISYLCFGLIFRNGNHPLLSGLYSACVLLVIITGVCVLYTKLAVGIFPFSARLTGQVHELISPSSFSLLSLPIELFCDAFLPIFPVSYIHAIFHGLPASSPILKGSLRYVIFFSRLLVF